MGTTGHGYIQPSYMIIMALRIPVAIFHIAKFKFRDLKFDISNTQKESATEVH